MLEHALALARLGFHVFPLVESSKLPLITKWQDRATRDEATIRGWWTCPVTGFEQGYNIGICTTRYGDDAALLVVDVDNKDAKRGSDTLLRLEMEGHEFPSTYQQRTPTGGLHLLYRAERPVKQGAEVFGPGLDVRSRGGFIVASGSVVPAGTYTAEPAEVREAPAWMIERCGAPTEPSAPSATPPAAVNAERAKERAAAWLFSDAAPTAVEGHGGDETTYKVAAKVKDFGVSEADAMLLMLQWNELCSPPWSAEDLQRKVRNAYAYGTVTPGASAPEMQFSTVGPGTQAGEVGAEPAADHPFTELNKEYAFVLAGGGHHVLWETTDARGRFSLEHLAEMSFHKAHAAEVFQAGSKTEPLTKAWMGSRERRSYRGLCFMPGQDTPEGWYNLWRGFAIEPEPKGRKETPHPEAAWAVSAWCEHLLKNVCRGDKVLARWLTGYFAHLVQRPYEKPLVALVFRGGKGVGKNALIELGMGPAKTSPGILGSHSMIVADRRYLVGNFNGHMESLLLLTFDEAFWSGDKQAEGILKSLITSGSHAIERKGHEPYVVENRCRVAIIGNEDWLVPASHDERRFAVFDVGDGRRNDREFFGRMERGMAAGGSALLLRYLLDFDLAGVDVNEAPRTSALLDQKTATLEPFYQWWLDCLTEGGLVGSDFGTTWPVEVEKDRFRMAFGRYLRERNIRTRMPDERAIGRFLKNCAGSITSTKRRHAQNTVWVYRLGSLAEHRAEWSGYMGHDVTWPAD